MYALSNADFYTDSGVVSDKCLLIDGCNIVGFRDRSDICPSLSIVDLCGLNVSAGFIDLQVNGGGGLLLNDSPDANTIEHISYAHRRFGTTSFLPTLITTTQRAMLDTIIATKQSMNNPTLGVIGLHLEGPYIAASKAGVHDKNHIRMAEQREIDLLLNEGVGVIALLTCAPESMPISLAKTLISNRIKVFFGHTNASFDLLSQYVREGVHGITHLFNAMSQLGSREPGAVGIALSLPEIMASVIADGHHVAWASLSAAKRAMGESIFLVTDAMPPVGSTQDTFVLGPHEVMRAGDRLMTADGTLAGSCLDMATSVRNCVQKVGIPLPEALRMASLYPARALGMSECMGSISPGKLADLVVFNNQVCVAATVKGGELEVHDATLLPRLL